MELSGTLDFRKIVSKVSQAKADYLKMIAQKRAAFRGLELDLKNSYLELKQHQFMLSRAQGDIKAARQIVFLNKSNLDIGLGDKKDYLDALQSYLVFQGRAYEAIFNYNSAVATLKMKMGTLAVGQKALYHE
jgi:outer membrane protein TolC